jgi:hypothetical protein
MADSPVSVAFDPMHLISEAEALAAERVQLNCSLGELDWEICSDLVYGGVEAGD